MTWLFIGLLFSGAFNIDDRAHALVDANLDCKTKQACRCRGEPETIAGEGYWTRRKGSVSVEGLYLLGHCRSWSEAVRLVCGQHASLVRVGFKRDAYTVHPVLDMGTDEPVEAPSRLWLRDRIPLNAGPPEPSSDYVLIDCVDRKGIWVPDAMVFGWYVNGVILKRGEVRNNTPVGLWVLYEPDARPDIIDL